MSYREEIRSWKKGVVGYIEEVPGGRLQAVSFSRGFLGFYDPSTDQTFTTDGKILRGNVLKTLFYEELKEDLE
ncbi:MAG: hypothetical protein ABIM42_03845 [candidate division WOR-3 bacterium]